MSTSLNQYLQDGANYQARAVLMLLQRMTIEESWNDEFQKYDAEPQVARWENCREQGYVVSLRAENHNHLHIAFFEHRNSDNICAIQWEQNCLNSPTIDTAKYGDACYSDKWDVSHKVEVEECAKMSDWISEALTKFWCDNRKEVSPVEINGEKS